MLDVSKMHAKKLQYKSEPFLLQEAITDALDQVDNLLIKHTIVVKGKCTKPINGDKTRITQVLTNLTSNAIKYSPLADKIILQIRKDNKQVIVSIQDFGIGIAKEHQQNVFKRFYRVAGSSEKSFKGFGLGLYLTAEIIRKHKGKIWVESTQGQGSTFFFTLPLEKRRLKNS